MPTGVCGGAWGALDSFSHLAGFDLSTATPTTATACARVAAVAFARGRRHRRRRRGGGGVVDCEALAWRGGLMKGRLASIRHVGGYGGGGGGGGEDVVEVSFGSALL